ncbi:MAG: DUF4331 domain-containing protein [Candidatus Dormibacteraceae bacterium]
MKIPTVKFAIALAAIALPLISNASSHREAPNIAGLPRVDGTDLYLFRSYEAGREGYVTLIANYIPFQDPQGGPNFYELDTHALYAINVNNTGDALPDISFQFRFTDVRKNLTVNAGGQNIAVPVLNIGPVDKNGKNLNVMESYTLTVQRRGWGSELAQNVNLGGTKFWRPVDNIGKKSIPDYPEYAENFIYNVHIPWCDTPGKVFVGQRKEGFVINVGEIFDLVNTNPVGPRNAEPNDLSHKNITSIALEVPIKCLTYGKDPVIAAWTTASLPTQRANDADSAEDSQDASEGSQWTQVSRLANPLVNEIVIGLPDKDKFNASNPLNDAQFLKYVTNPTLPVLLHALFGAAAVPPQTPRNDLVAAFLTGVKGLNQPLRVRPAELMRLNTSIPPTRPAAQKDLGVLAGDFAGFPNGRRPFDDVADIELRVVEGALCGKIGNCGSETTDPNHGKPYTDGARAAGPDAANLRLGGAVNPADTYLDTFPYLNDPLPGSPNGVAD